MKNAMLCVSLGVLIGVLLDPGARNSAAAMGLVLVLSLAVAVIAVAEEMYGQEDGDDA